MSPIFPCPSFSRASQLVSSIIIVCIFWYGDATSATGSASGPSSLELPTAPEGWSPLNLSVDTPRGVQLKTVMIRDGADDTEVCRGHRL